MNIPVVRRRQEPVLASASPAFPELDMPYWRSTQIASSPQLVAEFHELKSLVSTFPEKVGLYGKIAVLGGNVFADVPQNARVGYGVSVKNAGDIVALSHERDSLKVPVYTKKPGLLQRRQDRRFVKDVRTISKHIANDFIQIDNTRVVVAYDEVAAELSPDDSEPRWNTLRKLFNPEKRLSGPIVEKTAENIVFDAVEYVEAMLQRSDFYAQSSSKLWTDFGLGHSLAELSQAQKLHTWWLQHQIEIRNGYLPQTDHDKALLGKAMRSHALVGLAGLGVVNAFVQFEDAALGQELRAVDNGRVPKPAQPSAAEWYSRKR